MGAKTKATMYLWGGIHKLALNQQPAGIEFKHTGLNGGNTGAKAETTVHIGHYIKTSQEYSTFV